MFVCVCVYHDDDDADDDCDDDVTAEDDGDDADDDADDDGDADDDDDDDDDDADDAGVDVDQGFSVVQGLRGSIRCLLHNSRVEASAVRRFQICSLSRSRR